MKKDEPKGGTDIVHDIADRILSAVIERLDLPMDAMDRLDGVLLPVENEVRRIYGGDRVYIRRAEVTDDRKRAAIVRDYLASDVPPAEVGARHGVSRATLYRYLKK